MAHSAIESAQEGTIPARARAYPYDTRYYFVNIIYQLILYTCEHIAQQTQHEYHESYSPSMTKRLVARATPNVSSSPLWEVRLIERASIAEREQHSASQSA
jgi:hypothetical protein